MKVIVCNIGSTSFKFRLLEMDSEEEIARGFVERVGSAKARAGYRTSDRPAAEASLPIPGHRDAVRHCLAFLTGERGPLGSLNEIDGVGFKCVQAGERNGSVLLDREVLDAMEDYRDLAPAHNPPYLEAIRMFRDLLPGVPLVGVFEPGFHAGAPDYAKIYGTPYEWFERYGVRRYGYHGASHRFVTGETIRILRLPADRHRLITCHLGGSSSLCAFKDGIAVDTSMGFTPQSGLLQGTRIGDMDPFVLPFIMKRKGISLEQALEECSSQGGLAGLSGTSGDMRDINERIARGCPRATLARRKFIYDIKRYLGEYLVLMEGLDAVTFTGGIGQHDAELRAEVLSSLSFLGLRLDPDRNLAHGPVITAPDSAVAGLALATNEEIVVARETVRVIRGARPFQVEG